jgi:hypothetical protein
MIKNLPIRLGDAPATRAGTPINAGIRALEAIILFDHLKYRLVEFRSSADLKRKAAS